MLSLGADDVALRRWVRCNLLVRVRGGVYAAPSPDVDAKFLTGLRAAVAAGPDVVVSHRAAAHLHGLPIWHSRPRPEVTRVERGARIRGVLVHRYGVDADQVVILNGLPVTNIVRTLIDVCRVLPIPEALVPFDAAVRRVDLDRELLQALLEKLGDINHRKRVLQTSVWADGGSENPFESYSRGRLLCEGIPAPRLQWWVGDGADTWFRPDKLWPDVGLIGEADGTGKYRKEQLVARPNTLVAEKARQEWSKSETSCSYDGGQIALHTRLTPSRHVGASWSDANDRDSGLGPRAYGWCAQAHGRRLAGSSAMNHPASGGRRLRDRSKSVTFWR